KRPSAFRSTRPFVRGPLRSPVSRSTPGTFPTPVLAKAPRIAAGRSRRSYCPKEAHIPVRPRTVPTSVLLHPHPPSSPEGSLTVTARVAPTPRSSRTGPPLPGGDDGEGALYTRKPRKLKRRPFAVVP